MIEVGIATHTGLVREQNEDCAIAEYPVFAVADGMGGHAAGEVASALAIETLRGLIGTEIDRDALLGMVEEANRRVWEGGHLPEQRGMGTTLTGVAALGDGTWVVFNVGDSRVLLSHEGEFRQLTTDHSEVQDMVTLGVLAPEEAAVHPMRHIVTRSLGAHSTVDVDLERLDLAIGDRVLVCSDGLTDEVAPDEVFWALNAAANAQDAADALVQAALSAGGHDNISVIVLDVVSAPVAE